MKVNYVENYNMPSPESVVKAYKLASPKTVEFHSKFTPGDIVKVKIPDTLPYLFMMETGIKSELTPNDIRNREFVIVRLTARKGCANEDDNVTVYTLSDRLNRYEVKNVKEDLLVSVGEAHPRAMQAVMPYEAGTDVIDLREGPLFGDDSSAHLIRLTAYVYDMHGVLDHSFPTDYFWMLGEMGGYECINLEENYPTEYFLNPMRESVRRFYSIPEAKKILMRKKKYRWLLPKQYDGFKCRKTKSEIIKRMGYTETRLLELAERNESSDTNTIFDCEDFVKDLTVKNKKALLDYLQETLRL